MKGMKITLCGSGAFYDDMIRLKAKLEVFHHEVKLPPHEMEDADGIMIPVKEYYDRKQTAGDDDAWIWHRKAIAIRDHFDKIAWADAILVANYDKNNVFGYIGGNTLMEMGIAFYLKKQIYLLKRIPEISYKEELLAMKPVILNDNLSLIK